MFNIRINVFDSSVRWILLITLFIITGCAAVQPFPQLARAGDTITLAVGSPDGMTRDNIQVDYIPDANPGNVVDLNPGLRSVFKLYPDRTSKAWLYDDSLFSINSLEDAINHATWLTLISLDLPTSIPEGTGIIKVTPTSPDVYYPQVTGSITDVDIHMEILAGLGSPNPFSYEPVATSLPITRPLSDLEPAPQVIVSPPDATVSGCCGAIEFKVTAPWLSSTGQSVPDSEIFIVQDAQNRLALKRQINMNYARNGDQFTVIFVTPRVMVPRQSRFTITAKPGNSLGTVTLDSVRYFDQNGNELSGPAPFDYTLAVDGL